MSISGRCGTDFARPPKGLVICRAIIFLAVLSGGGLLLPAQQQVGYVLELAGSWTIGNQKESLTPGQAVPGGLLLVNSTPQDGDYIVVADLHGKVFKTIRCSKGVCRECTQSGACYDPIHALPNAGEPPNAISAMFSGVMELFVRKPARYSIDRERGLATMKCEVLKLDGHEVDLAPLMEGKPAGRYSFEFVPLSMKAPSKEAIKSVQVGVNWDPNKKSVFVVNGIGPGFYELRKDQDDDDERIAWILLATASEYQSMKNAFDDFVHQTDEWGDVVTPETKVLSRGAYLEQLSSGGSK